MMRPEEISHVADRLIAAIPRVVQPVGLVRKNEIRNGRGDDETFLLLISDLQTGHKTKTYNTAVLKERMKTLVGSVLKITDLHRKGHPVHNLEVCMLGDMIHSEMVGRSVSLDELECVVKEQVFDHAIPVLSDALYTLGKEYDHVNVRCVRGNHGSQGKFQATTTNWDDVVYRFLEREFSSNKRICFQIADNFYQLVKIKQSIFCLTHGDSIRMHLTIPHYGITQRLMRWQGSVGDFDYLVLGHFHNFTWSDWNECQYIVNGTFATDDDWVKKTLGLKGSCVQVLGGVHERRGLTFIRRIVLQ
jgi:UDP-2,3-diacylglucosamine pyrophosphatase LpxH